MDRPRRRIGRRGLITGAAALAALGAFLEYESLRGRFDHRSSAGASGTSRYEIAIAEIEMLETMASARPARASLVHVGHSTHLLSMGNRRLLTDPWFFDPAFGALRHEVSPAVRPNELGRLDIILVTHDHADHADARAMDQMDKRATVIVSTNELAARIRGLGFREVSVLAPWEERRFGDLTIAAVPGQHDIYEIGFVVRGSDVSVYFAGDTRLHPDLPAIAERFAPDVAILPVDGTRLTGGELHVMTPDDAVSATRTLKSRLVIPSHAEAVFSDPVVAHFLASTIAGAPGLFAEAMRRALPQIRCVVPEPGQRVTFEPA
jgi:L-ascorbate metabolism protein UlaG (beta-lactamase superfamily)